MQHTSCSVTVRIRVLLNGRPNDIATALVPSFLSALLSLPHPQRVKLAAIFEESVAQLAHSYNTITCLQIERFWSFYSATHGNK